MSTDDLDKLASLARGFRDAYLSYDELTAQVHGWAEAFPDLVRVTAIGQTPEGRSLWLLAIGPEPDRVRPAAWVDGNMHAVELAGSSVALAIAEDAIRLHLGDAGALPAPVARRLVDVLLYVLPRMSPDGAETVLQSGRYVRSCPRWDRPDDNRPRWRATDVDGDGLALAMRVRDPNGELAESADAPGLLLPRRIEDEGPFYKLYPEGVIERFDGHTAPTPSFLDDSRTDLNRNFPWSWAPEHEQAGAGNYPTSEPESRAVVDFTSRHPEIFAWLNLHTFGGVLIRPLGHKPDTKMDPADLALFRQIGAWTEELTGYPAVSGFEEFTYEPDKPLHGDLADYAFHQRGCVAYVIELWDLFRQIGMQRPKRFVDHYTHMTRDDMIALARWDAEHNHSRALPPWRAFEHPQLGPVEVGGFDPRIGVWNPPYEKLGEVCTQHSAAWLRVASLAPALVCERVTQTRIGDGVTRVDVTIENRGYLPTYVLSSAKPLSWNEPVFARVATDGCALDDPGDALREVGHLDGWGRGLHDGTGALFHPRTRGNTGEYTLSYRVRGSGAITVRAGSCRVGWIETTIEIG